jgi:hypothetical protein
VIQQERHLRRVCSSDHALCPLASAQAALEATQEVVEKGKTILEYCLKFFGIKISAYFESSIHLNRGLNPFAKQF